MQPRKPPPPPEPDRLPDDDPPAPATAVRVLVADDSAADAELLRRALRRHGYEPALTRVETEMAFRAGLQERPELIVLDQRMPYFSAVRALEILRAAGLDAPAVVVSGVVPNEVAVELMRSGASDFIAKDQLERIGPVVDRELSAARRRRELLLADAALQRQTRLLDETQRLAKVGGWLLDTRNGRLHWTIGTYGIFAVDPAAYQPEPATAHRFYHPDFQPVIQRAIARTLASGEAFDIECRLQRADGREGWVRVRGQARREDGRIVEVYGAIQDITRQIEVANAVRLSERRYRAARDSSLDALCFLESDGDGALRIVDVNRAAQRLYGRGREALVGGLFDALLSAQQDAELRAMCRRVARSLNAEEHTFYSESFGGRPRWLQHQVIPTIGGVAIASRDVTAARRANDELRYLAEHDALTGLSNRHRFLRELSQLVTQTELGDHGVLAVLDFDRFKEINDSLGHAAGDGLLRLLAERVRALLPAHASLARLGGDEFAIACAGPEPRDIASTLPQRLLEGFRAPFQVDGEEVFVTPSIGVVPLPAQSKQPDELLRMADIAMHEVKQLGGATFFIYRADDVPTASRRRLDMSNLLRHAHERGELHLAYQSQVEVGSGRIVGCEALLRWNSPELGPVPPDRFIPIAEETGLIVEIGAFVLQECCRQAAELLADGHRLRFGVNLSARQFRAGSLADDVLAALDASGLPPQCLELEITESLLMHSVERTRQLLHSFSDAGISVAIDDFGTGYSSLAYLKGFPVDALKVDRSFVQDIEADADSRAIVAAIVTMAQQLKLRVVAEGVETRAQYDYLAELGCNLCQGYLFSRPLPFEAFAALVAGADRAEA